MTSRNMVTEACWQSRGNGEQFPPGALQSKSTLFGSLQTVYVLLNCLASYLQVSAIHSVCWVNQTI